MPPAPKTTSQPVPKASKVAPMPKASKVAPMPKAAKASASSSKTAGTKAPAKKARKFLPWRNLHSHLFPKAPRVFAIGCDLPPPRDLTRFVRWPRYVRIQRQRSILKKRLKVPPAINQFSKTMQKNQAATLFRLLGAYRPESREQKKLRLKAVAESEAKGEKQELTAATKPLFIKYGLNHVTDLIEAKKAKLVVIAHDVDPIELVVWLPALCRKMNVPYCIVKGKARLGHLVHKKTASALAVTEVRKEDEAKLDQLITNVRTQFNENVADRRRWGGGILGSKAQAVVRKRNRALKAEAASKARA